MQYQALRRGSFHEAGGGPETINLVCLAICIGAEALANSVLLVRLVVLHTYVCAYSQCAVEHTKYW